MFHWIGKRTSVLESGWTTLERMEGLDGFGTVKKMDAGASQRKGAASGSLLGIG